jgi:hypothetical protein
VEISHYLSFFFFFFGQGLYPCYCSLSTPCSFILRDMITKCTNFYIWQTPPQDPEASSETDFSIELVMASVIDPVTFYNFCCKLLEAGTRTEVLCVSGTHHILNLQ